jgi:uncharacterized membrane protein YkoI
LRKIIVPEDETKKVAKAEAAAALKNRMRSRWEEINELRHSGHEPAKKVQERVAKRKKKRSEKAEDEVSNKVEDNMAQPKQIYEEKKRYSSASSVPANGAKEKKRSSCVVSQPKSRSKGESKSRKAGLPKKGRSKKEKDGLDGSNHSTGSRSVKSTKSTSSSNGRSKKEKDGLNGSNHITGSRSVNGTKSTSSSNSSSTSKDSDKSSSKSPSKKKRRQPKSLARPERLAVWQIREQLKHRVTPVNQLYNRRLDDDDDDDDDDGDKKKKKKKNKKAVSAIQNPRGTQKADGGYLGAKERRNLKVTRESLKKSILDSVVHFDETESNLPPAFRRLSS